MTTHPFFSGREMLCPMEGINKRGLSSNYLVKNIDREE